MKTIKIDELVHKELTMIKNYWGYKTLSETIDMVIGESWKEMMPGIENPTVKIFKDNWNDKSKK